MDKQKLLKKLKALAENGVGGEKVNAQKMLDKLMLKYGVSESDLNDDVTQLYDKRIRNTYERRLFVQVVYKVTNKKDTCWRYKKDATVVIYECTAAQNIEIEFLFDFYKCLMKKEIELLFQAFVQKHRIFGASDLIDEEDSVLSDEELVRLLNMMNSLSDETPQLQIEARKG